MSRRLLTAGLALAVLWGVQSGYDRIIAKPPDLPLMDNDVLISPPLVVEESHAPTAALAMEFPTLFQLRPSVRRTMASCFLFGVHPLLALAPTEGVVDLDGEDYVPAPTQNLEIPIQSNTFFMAVPSYGPAAPLVCPYMRQQKCAPDRHAVLFADPDFSHDVLQNLAALRQSRELLGKARELGHEGRTIEALHCLSQAAKLCPGSRFDEEIKAAAAEVLASGSDLKPEIEQGLALFSETLKVGLAAAGASEEEEEAPVDLPMHDAIEIGVGLDGGVRMFTQFQRGGAIWHFEYNSKGLSWWTSPDGGADAAPEDEY